MLQDKRSVSLLAPGALVLLGVGLILNACGESEGPGASGSGGTGTGASTSASTGSSSGSGTSTSGFGTSGSGGGASGSTGGASGSGGGASGSGGGASTSGTAGASTSGTGGASTSGTGGATTSTGAGAGGSGTIECDEPGGTVPPLKLTEVARGLTRPVFVTSEPAEASRLYVVQQNGLIRLMKNGAMQAEPFLDVSAIIRMGTDRQAEDGLLGLAFHPDYASNGRFFVYFNSTRNRAVIVQERRRSAENPDMADAEFSKDLVTIPDMNGNHNGGMLAFGPDGMLYIGVGDGNGDGSTRDPGNFSQNLQSKRGKILRIDVDTHPTPPEGNLPNADPDIWDYGLRNPWRFSFDRCRGDLYIGDVGAKGPEEINIEPRGQGRKNYGWNLMEGSKCHVSAESGCPPTNATLPVVEHSHDTGDGSITGGYVYRGSRIPALRGHYVYGDYQSKRIRSLVWRDGRLVSQSNFTADLIGDPQDFAGIASFGEDAAGELYVVDHHTSNGRIFRIDPE